MPASYPVAASAHDALARLRTNGARFMREREAETAAGAHVAFVTESAGPIYELERDALEAFKGLENDPACRLVCRLKPGAAKRKTPMAPAFKDGERWPKAKAPQTPVWQWSISYWKVMDTARPKPGTAPGQPARALRKKGGEALTPEELQALTETPMTAARPQKALDFGLFDFPLPENPAIIIADE